MDQQPPQHVHHERYDDKDEKYLYWSQAHSHIMHRPEPLRTILMHLAVRLGRSHHVRIRALVEAMGAALDAINTQDAHGFFVHCGYSAPVQAL
jgi:hypothetical protein